MGRGREGGSRRGEGVSEEWDSRWDTGMGQGVYCPLKGGAGRCAVGDGVGDEVEDALFFRAQLAWGEVRRDGGHCCWSRGGREDVREMCHASRRFEMLSTRCVGCIPVEIRIPEVWVASQE